MKKIVLILLFCSSLTALAAPSKTTLNPAIGVKMTGVNFDGNVILFQISIKNIGDEVLTTIFATDPFSTIQFQFAPITSLAPGEEINNLSAIKYGSCFDQSQIMVHATTVANTEITDLSADPNSLDNNNLPGSYYNNTWTNTFYNLYLASSQSSEYVDSNNNSLVDVGDVINYTYTISGNNSFDGIIYDSNAVIGSHYVSNSNYATTTGYHFLTQAEVDLGYVYNNSYFQNDNCGFNFIFSPAQPCSGCPNPTGANIVTSLTSLQPNRISGTVKFNANNDNCTTGLNFPNRRIATTYAGSEYATYTNNNGNYAIIIPNFGTYTTSPLTNLSSNFSSSPASTTVTSSGSGIDYNATNFCISSATNYADLQVNLFNINQAIPGTVGTYRFYYTNEGSTNLNGSVQLTFNNAKQTFISASPAQSSATATTLTWNYTNLLPFERRYVDLSFNTLIPPAVNVGDHLALTLVGNPMAGDVNTANNTFNLNQTVFSSFDPNDKTVLEGSAIGISQVGNYLNYITRFQNTGTANATTVVIKETLDPKLDYATFQPIGSSHTASVQIRNGNEVTYTFSTINLPYSSANEPASHGWMAYRIKPKTTVGIGDTMNSHSDIYFDYNAPVITNFVATSVVALSTNSFEKASFVVYPNPGSDIVTLNTTEAIKTIAVYDLKGQKLEVACTSNQLNVSQLATGVYIIAITDSTNTTSQIKFVKK
jgi:uncharacterized repeat protein (TIGR01451 family)